MRELAARSAGFCSLLVASSVVGEGADGAEDLQDHWTTSSEVCKRELEALSRAHWLRLRLTLRLL